MSECSQLPRSPRLYGSRRRIRTAVWTEATGPRTTPASCVGLPTSSPLAQPPEPSNLIGAFPAAKKGPKSRPVGASHPWIDRVVSRSTSGVDTVLEETSCTTPRLFLPDRESPLPLPRRSPGLKGVTPACRCWGTRWQSADPTVHEDPRPRPRGKSVADRWLRCRSRGVDAASCCRDCDERGDRAREPRGPAALGAATCHGRLLER